jgi:hypothetical protein
VAHPNPTLSLDALVAASAEETEDRVRAVVTMTVRTTASLRRGFKSDLL